MLIGVEVLTQLRTALAQLPGGGIAAAACGAVEKRSDLGHTANPVHTPFTQGVLNTLPLKVCGATAALWSALTLVCLLLGWNTDHTPTHHGLNTYCGLILFCPRNTDLLFDPHMCLACIKHLVSVCVPLLGTRAAGLTTTYGPLLSWHRLSHFYSPALDSGHVQSSIISS